MEGGQLARGTPGGETVAGAGRSAPAAPDLTLRWDDVWTRYEMLFGQRYGATDVTWEAYQPLYRWAWQTANQPKYRGRAWAEVEPDVQRAFMARHPDVPWERVEGGLGDVWEDVADEAQRGAEGGAERRELRPDAGTGAEGRPDADPERLKSRA